MSKNNTQKQNFALRCSSRLNKIVMIKKSYLLKYCVQFLHFHIKKLYSENKKTRSSQRKNRRISQKNF